MTNRSSSWWVEDACVPIWNTFDLIRRKHCGDCSSRPFKWNAMNDLCFDKFSPRWRACHAPYPRFIDPLLNRLWAVVISSRTIFTFPMPFPKLQWTPSLVLSLSSILEASFKNATLEQGQPLGFFEILQFFFLFWSFSLIARLEKSHTQVQKAEYFLKALTLDYILFWSMEWVVPLTFLLKFSIWCIAICTVGCVVKTVWSSRLILKKKKIIFCLLGEICQTLLSFCKFLNFIPSLILSPFLTLHAIVPPSSCPSIYALLLSSEFQVEKCWKNLYFLFLNSWMKISLHACLYKVKKKINHQKVYGRHSS